MKKYICMILALMLVLTGCQSANGATTPSTGEIAQATIPALTEGTLDGGIAIERPEGVDLPFENAGKVRLNYEGSRSYILYVTSVEELPKEGSWTGYDEAYFQTKALLIVVETLGSGSVQLELESIRVHENTASISIKRPMEGDVATTDMATWMLWAEVDKGLDYEWTLANATELPAGELY